MKKLLCGAFLSAVALSLGCAVTDYPVIFDSRGAYDNNVLQGQYDHAYIIPSGQVATTWSDGSDELFSVVAQDWKGDQWLKTYNNFDPTNTILFLDQTYCDPTREFNCAITTSWNPDVAGDDIFDYTFDTSCSGARSLSLLLSMSSRLGECGSGIFADRQSAALEFSNLQTVDFRGKQYYHLPIDSSVASFDLTAQDGSTTTAPLFGRTNLYLDSKLRAVMPIAPNMKYLLRWLDNYTQQHGNSLDVNLTYGSLNANFKVNVRGVAGALDRL